MEYLQRALERIIPDYDQIAETATQDVLFADRLFAPASLDASLCIPLDGAASRRVAFLAEVSEGRERKVEWMSLEEGRPSAVLANYVGYIEYIPAGAFYYHDYEKLRRGIAAAARGSARLANQDLLRLLCATRPTSPPPSGHDPLSIAERLAEELRTDGFAPDAVVVPEGMLRPPPGGLSDGVRVWSAAGLRRVLAMDTRRVGVCAAGPLRVLLGAHNQRNSYWVIAGRYLNAVVEEPLAFRWARVAR